MALLKNLAQLKSPRVDERSDNSKNGTGSSDESRIERLSLTYFQDGYGTSKNAFGNVTVLKASFDNLYQNFRRICIEDKSIQEKNQRPRIEEINALSAKRDKLAGAVDMRNAEKQQLESDVNRLNETIVDVKANPEKHGIDADKRPQAQFLIGLLLLAPITIYLLVFYISASYSAFFKEFDNTKISAAIFDAEALSKAYSDGWLEAIFVCTIPFVFMGLGYLIHMFQRDKNSGQLKVALLIVTTFIYDAILAYQIENKIYEFDKTPSDPPFNIPIALQSVEFWGIIFAGFITYIIWGFVLDFVINEHENMDKVKAYVRTLKERRDNILSRIEKVQDSIQALKSELAEVTQLVDQKSKDIESTIYIPEKEYLHYHHEYLKGWLLAITKELMMPRKEADELLRNCESTSRAHISELGFTQTTDRGISDTVS